MDQLDAMRVYVAVVEARGFSAASRILHMSLPTVCRKITDLESHLGAQLLIRTTRKVTTTDCGEHYYVNTKRILDDIDNLSKQAVGEFVSPKGMLTITAPSLFGLLIVSPIIHAFIQAHDEIDARLFYTNHVLNLPDEHIDLGFRIGEISDSSMTAIQLGTVRSVVCASPKYFSRWGKPSSPSDLLRHRCVSARFSGNDLPWEFLTESGESQHVAIRPKLNFSIPDAAVDSALLGFGITQLYSYQVARHIASGELELVLQGYEVEPVPVSIIFPRTRRTTQKVQSFVEFAEHMVRTPDSTMGIERI